MRAFFQAKTCRRPVRLSLAGFCHTNSSDQREALPSAQTTSAAAGRASGWQPAILEQLGFTLVGAIGEERVDEHLEPDRRHAAELHARKSPRDTISELEMDEHIRVVKKQLHEVVYRS